MEEQKTSVNSLLKDLIQFKPAKAPWHLAALSGICVGLPILVGDLTGHIQGGKLASTAGFVILYLHSTNMVNRMITLMACSFGLMLSFAIGLVFSFNPWIAPLVLAIFAFGIHLGLYYLKMDGPPGSFFFVMVASIAICMPFDPENIPTRVGLFGMGAMSAFLLGLMYSLITLHRKQSEDETLSLPKTKNTNLVESITFGIFGGIALLIPNLLHLDNPYWIPISCLAVMQGVSTQHIWTRSVQRVLGTFVGLCATYGILLLKPTFWMMSISIVVLQIVIQLLVKRNYGIAVIAVTIMTIFLAETQATLIQYPERLFESRFFDILIGSTLGAIGGWIIYNEKVHYLTDRQVRWTRRKLKGK